MARVVCLGILVADVVAKPVNDIPGRGKLGIVEKIELHTGGCASNTGAALRKLGVDTALIGKVGNDGFGDYLIKEMSQCGLNIHGIKRDNNVNTSCSLALVEDDGERRFIHCYGADGTFRESDIDWNIIKGCKILHIAGSFLMPTFDGIQTAHVLNKARSMGITTSLDTAWDAKGKWRKTIEPSLKYIDIFLPSIEEARMITGLESAEEIADYFLKYGMKIVGLKMGSEGCFVKSSKGEVVKFPVFNIDAVDATGAGDAFVAGFLMGVLNGWDMKKTAEFACAVGACCVEAMGAKAGIRSFDETIKFIEDHKQGPF
ncbi:MAG: sugar kinase [bacterium]|nr:sugar kinase [bacterium]